MFKRIGFFAAFAFTSLHSLCFAGCCGFDCNQSVEFGLGWRKDNLKWDLKDAKNSCISAKAKSDLRFKDIEMYTVNGKARWAGSEYYIRLSGDYGSSFKGEGLQDFSLSASPLSSSVSGSVSNAAKGRSEFYDFTCAVGYPFMTCCKCWLIVPLVGYSFHRQRIRIKEHKHNSFSSDFSLSSSNPFFSSSSVPSSYYSSSSSGSSGSSSSSDVFDPLACSSLSNVAELVGFSPETDASSYRFTWFGPFVGLDISYGLDDRWTVFGELELHFYDRCNRKRKSCTAVSFIDKYHSKNWAYGINGTVGATWAMGSCWYGTVAVDFKCWKTDGHKDRADWGSVGANVSLGYMF